MGADLVRIEAGMRSDMTALEARLVEEMSRLQSRALAVQTATNLATVVGVLSLVLYLVQRAG